MNNFRNMKGGRQDSRSDYSNAVSHFALAGTAGNQLWDFSKIWIDDGGSVRHYTHDRDTGKPLLHFLLMRALCVLAVVSPWPSQALDLLSLHLPHLF